MALGAFVVALSMGACVDMYLGLPLSQVGAKQPRCVDPLCPLILASDEILNTAEVYRELWKILKNMGLVVWCECRISWKAYD
jgi:hypothetical protein